MHGGLAPFNAVNWPLPTRLQLAVTRHRAAKDAATA